MDSVVPFPKRRKVAEIAQVERVENLTGDIRSSLQSIVDAKRLQEHEPSAETFPESLKVLLRSCSVLFMELKECNRELFIDSEVRRVESQRHRSKADQLVAQLQSVEYEKAFLQREIRACNESSKLKAKYVELVPAQLLRPGPANGDKPATATDDEARQQQQHQAVKAVLTGELNERKALCAQLDERKQRKKALAEAGAQKRGFLDGLQARLVTIKKSAQSIQQFISPSAFRQSRASELAVKLPPPLYAIYHAAHVAALLGPAAASMMPPAASVPAASTAALPSSSPADASAGGQQQQLQLLEVSIGGTLPPSPIDTQQQPAAADPPPASAASTEPSSVDRPKLQPPAPSTVADQAAAPSGGSKQAAAAYRPFPLHVTLEFGTPPPPPSSSATPGSAIDAAAAGVQQVRRATAAVSVRLDYYPALTLVSALVQGVGHGADRAALSELYPGDSGLSPPQPLPALKAIGQTQLSLQEAQPGVPGVLGRPYRWAQWLSGGRPLAAAGSSSVQPPPAADAILDRIAARLRALVSLHSQLDSLAKLSLPPLLSRSLKAAGVSSSSATGSPAVAGPASTSSSSRSRLVSWKEVPKTDHQALKLRIELEGKAREAAEEGELAAAPVAASSVDTVADATSSSRLEAPPHHAHHSRFFKAFFQRQQLQLQASVEVPLDYPHALPAFLVAVTVPQRASSEPIDKLIEAATSDAGYDMLREIERQLNSDVARSLPAGLALPADYVLSAQVFELQSRFDTFVDKLQTSLLIAKP
eukprot:TRINITY_DN6968_c0_g2_i2.p1 TRINITY_DN6968_c0_g2~~TRINITY_DN6968_c0_g2_i2.p1  ORF type:complete len:773 (-),score=278.35 TRINITY_DN6968_c0_g2_i2:53-2338(-)